VQEERDTGVWQLRHYKWQVCHWPNLSAGWARFSQSQDDLIRTFAAVGLSDRLRPVSSSGTILIVPPSVAAKIPSPAKD
jgi:hypothetical protein